MTDRELIEKLVDALSRYAGVAQISINELQEVDRIIVEARAALAAPEWVPVIERLPDSGPVLAMVARLHGGKRSAILRVRYVNKHEIECNGDFEGDTEYDETSDRHCWPVGWYEWNECEETHWFVAGEVTHWQPLPTPPETKNE